MPPELDLSHPRRTSPLGALLSVFEVEQLRSLLPVVIIAASSGRFLLVFAIALVLGAVYNLLAWWRRTWWFAGGVLHLDEGVIVHNQRRIPVDRIQHVEIERKLRHQALDLSVVRVETAGGSGAELALDGIAMAEAEALRDLLATPRVPTLESSETGGDTLVRLPPARLLLAGVTGPEVAAVLAALAVGLDLLVDLGVDPGDVSRFEATTLGVVVLVLVGIPLWFLVAGCIGVVRRWDLTATIDGDDLRVTYGLLRRAEFAVNLTRVQDVRIAHRLLLRPFGRADIRVRTAASGAGQQSRVDIPLLDAAEIDRVLARVLPAALPLPALRPAPAAARRRAWVRRATVGALLGTLVAVVGRDAGPTVLVALPAGAVLGAMWGEAYYRGLGAEGFTPSPVVHGRTGAFTRHHEIVPTGRVQSTAVESTLFQRRRDLADVRLDLAGTHVTIVDRSSVEAVHLTDAVYGTGTTTAPASVTQGPSGTG